MHGVCVHSRVESEVGIDHVIAMDRTMEDKTVPETLQKRIPVILTLVQVKSIFFT